jgi:hypothetical protein
MSGFIKQVYLPDQNCYFLLSEIFVPEGRKFLISTVKEGKSVLFEMGCEGMKGWRIYDPAPCWIKSIEPRIIDAVKAHLQIFDEEL